MGSRSKSPQSQCFGIKRYSSLVSPVLAPPPLLWPHRKSVGAADSCQKSCCSQRVVCTSQPLFPRVRQPWVLILDPLLSGCVILGKLRALSELSFIISKMGTMIVPPLWSPVWLE